MTTVPAFTCCNRFAGRPAQSGGCAECAATGRNGYCAPNRCYCGHLACPAYPTRRRTSAQPKEKNS